MWHYKSALKHIRGWSSSPPRDRHNVSHREGGLLSVRSHHHDPCQPQLAHAEKRGKITEIFGRLHKRSGYCSMSYLSDSAQLAQEKPQQSAGSCGTKSSYMYFLPSPHLWESELREAHKTQLWKRNKIIRTPLRKILQRNQHKRYCSH